MARLGPAPGKIMTQGTVEVVTRPCTAPFTKLARRPNSRPKGTQTAM
jgi:hypothetical protein